MPRQNNDDAAPRVHELVVQREPGMDHIAYATRDTDKTAALFEVMGFVTVLHKLEFKRHNIYVSKMRNDRNDMIELIEPIASPSKVEEILSGREAMLYHACFKVDDFFGTYRRLRATGAIAVTQPFESVIFSGYMVSHMFHINTGLFEIFGKDPRGTPGPEDSPRTGQGERHDR
jgi:hypothetical protein